MLLFDRWTNRRVPGRGRDPLPLASLWGNLGPVPRSFSASQVSTNQQGPEGSCNAIQLRVQFKVKILTGSNLSTCHELHFSFLSNCISAVSETTGIQEHELLAAAAAPSLGWWARVRAACPDLFCCSAGDLKDSVTFGSSCNLTSFRFLRSCTACISFVWSRSRSWYVICYDTSTLSSACVVSNNLVFVSQFIVVWINYIYSI